MVFPGGKVDEPGTSDGKRVLTPGQAYEVTKILEGVITSGTGAGYTSIGCSSEAGKTGTSEGLSDAWFVGYTPLYSTAVWTGHPLSRDYTGYGGPTSGPDLALLHGGRPGGQLPRLRRSLEPAEPVVVPRGAHVVVQLELLQLEQLRELLLVFVLLQPDDHDRHPQQRQQQGRLRARCGTEARAVTEADSVAADRTAAQRRRRHAVILFSSSGPAPSISIRFRLPRAPLAILTRLLATPARLAISLTTALLAASSTGAAVTRTPSTPSRIPAISSRLARGVTLTSMLSTALG